MGGKKVYSKTLKILLKDKFSIQRGISTYIHSRCPNFSRVKIDKNIKVFYLQCFLFFFLAQKQHKSQNKSILNTIK